METLLTLRTKDQKSRPQVACVRAQGHHGVGIALQDRREWGRLLLWEMLADRWGRRGGPFVLWSVTQGHRQHTQGGKVTESRFQRPQPPQGSEAAEASQPPRNCDSYLGEELSVAGKDPSHGSALHRVSRKPISLTVRSGRQRRHLPGTRSCRSPGRAAVLCLCCQGRAVSHLGHILGMLLCPEATPPSRGRREGAGGLRSAGRQRGWSSRRDP